jgi:pilus assembly protein Flp/PilA
MKNKSNKIISNQKGQGLIEYLLLTALLAIATMGVIRLLGHSVSAKFADITNMVQGQPGEKATVERVQESDYKKKDMSDFMNGAASK